MIYHHHSVMLVTYIVIVINIKHFYCTKADRIPITVYDNKCMYIYIYIYIWTSHTLTSQAVFIVSPVLIDILNKPKDDF